MVINMNCRWKRQIWKQNSLNPLKNSQNSREKLNILRIISKTQAENSRFGQIHLVYLPKIGRKKSLVYRVWIVKSFLRCLLYKTEFQQEKFELWTMPFDPAKRLESVNWANVAVAGLFYSAVVWGFGVEVSWEKGLPLGIGRLCQCSCRVPGLPPNVIFILKQIHKLFILS